MSYDKFGGYGGKKLPHHYRKNYSMNEGNKRIFVATNNINQNYNDFKYICAEEILNPLNIQKFREYVLEKK